MYNIFYSIVIFRTAGSGGALWFQRDSPDFRVHTHLWARTDLFLSRSSPLWHLTVSLCMCVWVCDLIHTKMTCAVTLQSMRSGDVKWRLKFSVCRCVWVCDLMKQRWRECDTSEHAQRWWEVTLKSTIVYMCVSVWLDTNKDDVCCVTWRHAQR